MQKAWEDDYYEQTSDWSSTEFLSVPGKQERQGLEVGISLAESEVLLLKEDFLQKN